MEYEIAEEFLADIKKEFGGEDEETVKVAELKRLEQRERTMKEFVQEFRRVARDSGYCYETLNTNNFYFLFFYFFDFTFRFFYFILFYFEG